jgi:hypothetical protein
MALSKSILGILSGITIGLAALTAQPAAAAEAGECSMVLAQAQDARSSLDAITTAMEQGMADRAAWVQRAAEIDSELAGMVGEKNETTERLVRERAEIVVELRVLDTLHPKLSNQADALQTIVDETERAYISCIEASI